MKTYRFCFVLCDDIEERVKCCLGKHELFFVYSEEEFQELCDRMSDTHIPAFDMVISEYYIKLSRFDEVFSHCHDSLLQVARAYGIVPFLATLPDFRDPVEWRGIIFDVLNPRAPVMLTV